MARSRKHSPRTIVLHRKVPIEVSPLPFRSLQSVRNLDLDALARLKRARIEVGHFETGCCRRVVHAVIRNGKVTNFEIEPCKDPARLSPDMNRIVRDAHRALRARSPRGPRFPLPVHDLPGAVARLKYSAWVCVRICCFGYCLTCCVDVNWVSSVWMHCGISTDPRP